MKMFLLSVFAVLLALTAVAALWRPSPPQDGRTRLTWVSDNNPARAEQISIFNNQQDKSTLVLDYGNSNVQKIILQTSSGVGPDVFDILDSKDLQKYVEAGVLWDVTDEAKRLGFSASKDTWPNAFGEITYFGRQYTFPCNLFVDLVLFNKTIFDRYGVPYPEGVLTWDEFMKLASVFKDRAAEGGPVYPITNLNWKIFFASQRGEYFDADGRPILATSPELKRAFEYHRDFIFHHKLMPRLVDLQALSGQGGWGAGALNQFASGRFAMMVIGEWGLIGLNRTISRQIAQGDEIPESSRLRLGCFLIPRYPDRPAGYRIRSRMTGINAHSPRKEEALAFLQYLAGPEYSAQVNREMDALPGNPRYVDLGFEPGPPELGRKAIRAASIAGMQEGYTPRPSPFLLTDEVETILEAQANRLESNPALTISSLLETAQKEAEVLLRRNLDRDPQLRERYEALTAEKKQQP